jgi:hypothetical protein
LAVVAVNARDRKDTTNLWTKKETYPSFFESAYNKEWLGGGTSNIAGNFSLNYDFNYKRSSCLG